MNSAIEFPHLFIKEKEGLELIEKQKIIKVPAVIDCFEFEGKQILLLEWINDGLRTDAFWKKFVEQLATLYQVTHDSFGLSYDNYMGSVVQQNKFNKSWSSFLLNNAWNR